MKFTVNWLKHYVDCDLDPAALAHRLTMAGLEVDSVEDLGAHLGFVVVARIEAVAPHPNADKLVLCTVAAGSEPLRVVCGAPNARAGMVTALALPGAELPGGLTVKPAKIRGQESAGMLCSERELELGDGHGGIMDLPHDLTVGSPIADALGLNDVVIEVDLTPNRPDCTSVIGIAREVAGLTGTTLRKPLPSPPPLTGKDLPFAVEVVDPAGCPRYTARLIKNVRIGPSPEWLARTLKAVGLRPINNVVDVTNFVMLEYGQPLHAFDFERLAGGKIVVRRAVNGERMTTLDGTERILDEAALLICDAEKPVALAGIMGGANSEVSGDTTDILLESAYFDPVCIRRTARLLKMGTDASYRFERGIDPNLPPEALERATRLIVEIAGGEAVPGGIDCCAGIAPREMIRLRAHKVRDLLGLPYTTGDVANLLARIEIASREADADTLEVRPPSFRVDLEREVDLIEEVARLHGYNEIPSSLPTVPMSFSEMDPARGLRQRLTAIMTGLGCTEAINYSFIARRHADMIGLMADDPRRVTVDILNPLSEDQAVMRTTLLPGLLENVRHNLNRQSTDLRLFETGKVFLPSGRELPDERQQLGAVLTGRRNPGASLLHFGDTLVDLLDVKGIAEAILAESRLRNPCFVPPAHPPPYAKPGDWAEISCQGQMIGAIGAIRREVLRPFGIKQDVFYLELDLDRVRGLLPEERQFHPLPRFPWVKWDLAFIVPDSVGGGTLTEAIAGSGLPHIAGVEVFDIYRGEPVAKGSKSIALRITYHSTEQTLDDETVGKIHQKVIDMVVQRFQGQLREM